MLHPSRCCAKGFHVATKIDGQHTRCVWCGLVARIGASDSDASAPVVSKTPAAPQSGCCDSVSRQAHYPRPTITERHDDLAVEFDERFRVMARSYATDSAALRHWQQQGNKLPSVYR